MIEKLDKDCGKLQKKINELVDAVNELQNRIDPPSVYQVMKDKDAIIGKHIGKKQRLQDELKRTRKALDVATKYIKHTQKVSPFWFNHLANETLDKIKTALEQKDVK